ncbi:cytochrome bc complex cytochrome b subunit [filamentous cyanobacterium LEGE 11480]|uniref:Cytochrome bc complex cytochrome b subunit n=1 Tax=Romeriopsis navalis LEGE 11480 TaxID=2777977 RepID=A0A928VIX7_9CYAN|nr:cytochrome b N-terminal domain-containing protein [Romeriopsis navalis]MBE9028598.1 cytochrome bc complex cytochrome b subunit [Romeriopsis navalis LEGE 11480]
MTTFQVSVPKLTGALRRLSTVLAIALLTLTLTAAVTGLLIAYYYQPGAGVAYDSLKVISQDVNYGWLVRRLHDLAGNALIILSLVQIVVMFLGERLRRSWLGAWFTGLFLTLTAMGLSWTAIILDWSQVGYWRMKVELGQVASIPLIGPTLAEVLTGGSLGTLTVAHMYAIHSYVLSLAALGLSIAHLVSLIYQERDMNRQI